MRLQNALLGTIVPSVATRPFHAQQATIDQTSSEEMLTVALSALLEPTVRQSELLHPLLVQQVISVPKEPMQLSLAPEEPISLVLEPTTLVDVQPVVLDITVH